MLDVIITTIIIIFGYNTLRKYGWVPIRNKLLAWLTARIPAIAKAVAFFKVV